MKVLRDNKESLMAVLEAFVYDPLISKRQQYLLATQVRANDILYVNLAHDFFYPALRSPSLPHAPSVSPLSIPYPVFGHVARTRGAQD